MKAEYKFKLGGDEFTVSAEVEGPKEFIEQMSFYANLPKVGPNGETDLKVTYRKVREYEYYSIVSKEAGQEYKFGQNKQGGTLFEKGWEALYQADGEGEEEGEAEGKSASGASRLKKLSKRSQEEEPETEEEETETEAPPAKAAKPPAKKAEEEEAPEEPEEKAPAKPASGGQSKLNGLMAKYGVKPGANSNNLRR